MISRPLSARDVQVYRLCEDATGALVYGMVIFSPWAFGSTQRWAMWTMNVGGFLLGLLLLTKLFLRYGKRYPAPRWDSGHSTREVVSPQARQHFDLARLAPRGLLLLTLLLLAYTFTSALNARATYEPNKLSFDYHEYIKWLPHSLDSSRTWFWSWNYLALALSFWAIRDWLLGKTEREAAARSPGFDVLPERLRKLLWLLAINGGLLAVEGIIQRLEGSGYLLFLVKPRVNPGAEAQFGPFAYRANAASYFNLLWPCCLGFWWTLHRYTEGERGRLHILLLCAALMAACPLISTSRGGAIVTAFQMALGMLFLVLSQFILPSAKSRNRVQLRATLLLLLFCGIALSAGFLWGWESLKPRIAEMRAGFALREEMFDKARPMARDYPLFGTGPGTFGTVFQHYRFSTKTYWPAQLHNDWLETRITFGWAGSALIALAMLTVFLRWFARGGIHGGRRFVGMIWIGLAGCLLHARWDFPFQIYSILFLWIVLSAILFTLSRRPWQVGGS